MIIMRLRDVAAGQQIGYSGISEPLTSIELNRRLSFNPRVSEPDFMQSLYQLQFATTLARDALQEERTVDSEKPFKGDCTIPGFRGTPPSN